MFLRYAYQRENGNLVLYLYKTTQYEFAKDLEKKDDLTLTLEEEAFNYVKKHNLPLSFDKVYILLDGKIVKTLPKDFFENNTRTLTHKKQDEKNFYFILKGKSQDKRISLFQYLMGSLFTNVPFKLYKEALKALIILYRTYALDQIKEKGYIKESNSFIIYKDPIIYKLIYLERFKDIYKTYEEAILETEGKYLLSQGKPIKPYVHLVSSGRTKENYKDSYLVTKNSLWDMKAKNYLQQFFFSYEDLSKKLYLTNNKANNLPHYSKSEIATLLNLPSSEFTCIEEKDGITFLSKGVGNDLGMSLFGANYLAEQGFSYSQILSYYFQNIILYHL